MLVYLWQDTVFAWNCVGCEPSDSVLHLGTASLYILEAFVIFIFFLSSSSLFLFFFQKFGVNQSKPEFTVDLKGALIDWASKDKSSKKNVIEVNYFT